MDTGAVGLLWIALLVILSLAYLFAPALRHALAALLALALALTVFGVDRWIASLAGLS